MEACVTGSRFLLTGVDHTTHTGTHAMQIATHTHMYLQCVCACPCCVEGPLFASTRLSGARVGYCELDTGRRNRSVRFTVCC